MRLNGARQRCSGLTMLELLIAVAVLSILITVAMPDVSDMIATRRLVDAAEQVHAHLQQARSESVSRSTAAYANFSADGSANWVYGISTVNSLCDTSATLPTAANACVMVVDDGDGTVDPGDGSLDTGDLVLMRFTSAGFGDVAMSISGFSSGNTQFEIDPVRGTSTSGQVDLVSDNGKRLRIKVSLLGRVRLCSPDASVTNYPSAGC